MNLMTTGIIQQPVHNFESDKRYKIFEGSGLEPLVRGVNSRMTGDCHWERRGGEFPCATR